MAVESKNLHAKTQTKILKPSILIKTLWITKELRNFQTTKEIQIYNHSIFLLSSKVINLRLRNFKIKIRHSSNLIIIKSQMSNLISLFKIKMFQISHMLMMFQINHMSMMFQISHMSMMFQINHTSIHRTPINTISIILYKIQSSNRSMWPSAALISLQDLRVFTLVELCPVQDWLLLVYRLKLTVTNILITKVPITLIIH